MKIIVCEGGKEAQVRDVEKLDLNTMQRLVDGSIECVSLEEGVDLWLNEEGRLRYLPFNRDVQDERGAVWDILGNFFLCGMDDEGCSVGLTKAQLVKWLPRLTQPFVDTVPPPVGFIKVYHAQHPTFMTRESVDGMAHDHQPPWPRDFREVAWVRTDDEERAYQRTNHVDRPWWKNSDVTPLVTESRSSSVGDVLQKHDSSLWRVDAKGFYEIKDLQEGE